MMEAVRTSETSVDNHFTRQYNPEDSSEHHTRRRENLKFPFYLKKIFALGYKASEENYYPHREGMNLSPENVI
jgi:hypothetical protein